MPRKYSDEFKVKAVRLAEELVELEGCSKWGAAVEIGDKLGISAHMTGAFLAADKPSPEHADVSATQSAPSRFPR